MLKAASIRKFGQGIGNDIADDIDNCAGDIRPKNPYEK
jgi:hypothetical protein